MALPHIIGIYSIGLVFPWLLKILFAPSPYVFVAYICPNELTPIQLIKFIRSFPIIFIICNDYLTIIQIKGLLQFFVMFPY